MRVLKISLFNILGFIAGVIVGNIVFLILEWFFMDLLGRLKFLTAILSWPVDYGTYAFTGIIVAVAATALYTCAAICKLGKGTFNFACILVGLYEIVIYMIAFIETLSNHGFDFDVLWMMIVTLGTFAIFSFSTAANAEL